MSRGVRGWCSALALVLFGLYGVALADLPSGFRVLRQLGKPCRLLDEARPWVVQSGQGRYPEVVAHALEVWNREAVAAGKGPFFRFARAGERADLVIDWSGTGLPPDKAAGVFWDVGLGFRRVQRLVMDGSHRIPDGNRAEILIQELGHVLGLGDSSDPGDLMYPVMRRRRLSQATAAHLSPRDRQALSWLYAQPDGVPILAPGELWPRPVPRVTPVPAVREEILK